MFRYLLLIFLPLSSLLTALPSAPKVQGDSSGVFFSHSSSQQMGVTIQDNKAIIHWDSFSLHPSESVNFHFTNPNEDSAVLNRVTSSEVSNILGTLQSNGTVVLLNPNGILFGHNSSIDTNSFIASTLDLADAEFMKENALHFQGSSTTGIINFGTIQALGGDVALIGRHITNEGTISAPDGSVFLGAGTELLLQPSKTEPLFISVSKESQKQLENGILNKGNIEASRAHLIADGNLYKFTIKQNGRIDALDVQKHKEEVWLVAKNGNVTIDGEIHAPGGHVRVLGNCVALLEKGIINTSSDHGGGEVLFGGSFQGKDQNIINSTHTFIDKNAQICVNAKLQGNGGCAIVWSDEHTVFLGTIEAQGGLHSGDGGFVEVSGKHSLQFHGTANRTSPHGKPGTLLLDPANIIINSETRHNIDMLFNPSNNTTLFQPIENLSSTSSFSQLRLCDLMVALNTGPVEISTSSAAQNEGDIIIATPIVPATGYTVPHTLTLSSDRDLLIQSALQNGGTGDIICNVGRDLYIDGSINVSSIGSRDGNVHITTQRNLCLFGAKEQAQIGYDGPLATGNINLQVGKDLIMQTHSNFALIGHTHTSRCFIPRSVQGNINISSVGGKIIMKGGDSKGYDLPFSLYCWEYAYPEPSAEKKGNSFYPYCQIGHATPNTTPHDSSHFSAAGTIHIHNVNEGIVLFGGKHDTKGGYVLIGHGGRENHYDTILSGTISISSKGPITLLGSQSSAPENFCGIGFAHEIIGLASHCFNLDHISVHSDADITIQAGRSPNPSFIGAFSGNAPSKGNTQGHIHNLQVSAKNITISGRSKNPHGSDAVIGIAGKNNTLSSNIYLKTQNNCTIRSGLERYGDSNAYIYNGKEGNIKLSLQQGDINLIGGASSGKAYIASGGALSIHVQTGNLNITPRDNTYITARDQAYIYAKNDINIFGNPDLKKGSITSHGGLTIQADHNINLYQNSLIQNTKGDLLLISGKDIQMHSTSYINNLAKKGRTILVVDHNFSLPSTYGSGLLKMYKDSYIDSNSPIHIFTSQQHLNTIQGRINRTLYVTMPLFIDTPSEQWLTYFSSSLKKDNQPFTIFYKDGFLSRENIEKTHLLISIPFRDFPMHDECSERCVYLQSVYNTHTYNKKERKNFCYSQVHPNRFYKTLRHHHYIHHDKL